MNKKDLWWYFKNDNKSFNCEKCNKKFPKGTDFFEIKHFDYDYERNNYICFCEKCFIEEEPQCEKHNCLLTCSMCMEEELNKVFKELKTPQIAKEFFKELVNELKNDLQKQVKSKEIVQKEKVIKTDDFVVEDGICRIKNHNIKELDVSWNDIAEIIGLENCKDLEILDCSGNYLTQLDVSHNINLKELRCEENHLTELDVSHNHKLELLVCVENDLDVLNISYNPILIDYIDDLDAGKGVIYDSEQTELVTKINKEGDKDE